ncbi:MAG: hypothetical protein WA941_11515 [Nitrososphaeraceae archaeon]
MTQEQAYANMERALNELMIQVWQHTFTNETQEQKNAALAPYDQAAVRALKDYAVFLPPEEAERIYNQIAHAEAAMKRTEDDGYTYPKNATEEEKATIDAQEQKAWVDAGRPGAPQ